MAKFGDLMSCVSKDVFKAEVTFKVKVKNADFIQCNIFLVYLNDTSSLPQN